MASADLYPRCPRCGDKGHGWHGLRCLRDQCGCLTSWVEPVGVAPMGVLPRGTVLVGDFREADWTNEGDE